MTTTLEDNQLLTRRQVGELIGLRDTALKKALAAPDAPPAVVFNRRVVRYRQADVIAWIERRRRPAPVEPFRAPIAMPLPMPGTRQRRGGPRKHTIATEWTIR